VFAERERVLDGEPARHQVEELPALTVRVLEHRAQRLACPACGGSSTAELPRSVAASCFGPRLQAALVALSVRNRVSRRDVVELGEELFGARLSVGSVDAILTSTSDALAKPYEDLFARPEATSSHRPRQLRTRLTPTARQSRCARCSMIDLAALAPPMLHGVLARSLYATRLFNLTITNVPGPQVALHCLGAPLREVYPLVPLLAEHSVGIAVFSYNGRVAIGISADCDSCPDLDVLVAAIDRELVALRALAPTGVRKRRTASARSGSTPTRPRRSAGRPQAAGA
jgi:hypothetical protein